MQPPSGAQWEIRHGAQRAVIVEVGGGLRTYTVDDWSVLDGYALEAMADGGRGQPLLPWPNRIADGRYTFDGFDYQLPIDEVSRHNAIHGLTRWASWTLQEQLVDRLTVGHVVHPRPGYAFTLDLSIQYALDHRGLTVRTRAQNIGSEPLPFGAGQHPYFRVGTDTVDPAYLQLPASTLLELDPERRLPTGKQGPVGDTPLDFRGSKVIGELRIDDCFTDLSRDGGGRARAILKAPDGMRTVTVWLDENYKYLQVFTGDTLSPRHRRRGLALEPMTCPPNAFRSGIDLLVLAPDEAVELEWGIAPALATR